MQLTDRQQEVVKFITSNMRISAPTLREITEAFAWSGPGAAQGHIDALRKKGVLTPPTERLHTRKIQFAEPSMLDGAVVECSGAKFKLEML